MTRKGGGMFADGYNQLATAQSLQRSLNVDDVIVDGDFFPKARHVLKDERRRQKDEYRRMKEESRRMK